MPSVVISASRVEESVGKSGSSITLIPQEEIQARASITLEDALRGHEGIVIQSFQGQSDILTTLNLRGSESNQTLLLIDGIEVNSLFNQNAEVGSIDLFNIDHIEVVRGPQSALYGSQAMGGVIQVFTEDPEPEEGNRSTVLGESGNLRTARGGVSLTHADGDYAHQLSYARFVTAGDFEHSAIQTDQAAMHLRWRHGTGALRTTLLYRKTDEEYFMMCCALFDPLPDAVTPPTLRYYMDSNAVMRQDWMLIGVNYSSAPLPWLDFRLGASHHEEILDDENPAEAGITGYYPFVYDTRIEGIRDRIEWQQNMRLQEKDIVTLLLEYTREDARKTETSNFDSSGIGPVSEQASISGTRENRAVALQMLIDSTPHDRLTFGWRADHHTLYGRAVTPRATYAHLFVATGTRFRTAYGEGIRAPSLNENFHPIQGNPDLKPEENESVEVGISQFFPWKETTLSWTYHRALYKNLIQVGGNPADPSLPLYVNVGNAEVKGHESTLSWLPLRYWILDVTYSTLQTKDLQTGQPLPFRPRYSLFVNVRYKGERLGLNGEFHRVSDSFMPYFFLQDVNGTPLGDRMEGYKRVDIAGSYDLDPGERKVGLYARVDNLFDWEVVEISGFPIAGRMFSAGIRAEF